MPNFAHNIPHHGNDFSGFGELPGFGSMDGFGFGNLPGYSAYAGGVVSPDFEQQIAGINPQNPVSEI